MENKELKIISLNTWGGRAGKEKLIEFFKENKDIDIFCLQEVYNGGKEFEKGTNFESNITDYEGFNNIKNILKDFHFYFRPCLGNHYGLAIFVKKDLDVLKEGDFFVHKEKYYIPEDHLGFHAKNIQYLSLNLNGKVFNVCNFHGLWTGKGKDDTEDRINQSQNIIDFIKTFKGEVILCGDFNLNPDTESIKIIEDFGLINLIKEHNVSSTRTSLYVRRETNPFADYTFTSKGVEVKSFEIMPDEVSDHAAMKLIVKI